MDILEERVLVLNRAWQPVNITSVRHAITLLCIEAARVIEPGSFVSFSFEQWRAREPKDAPDERFIHGCGWRMHVPEVVVLQHFNGYPRMGVKLSRGNVLARDRHACQYCGECLPRTQLTVDHILPKSRGGRSSWENLVAACRRCNTNKRDRTPEEAGLRLLHPPRRPRWQELSFWKSSRPLPPSWASFILPHFSPEARPAALAI